MWSYCHLNIWEIWLFASSSYAISTIMTIFRESDRKKWSETIDEWDGDIYEYNTFSYGTTAWIAKKRLEIMWFSGEKIKAWITERQKHLEEYDFEYLQINRDITFDELLLEMESCFQGIITFPVTDYDSVIARGKLVDKFEDYLAYFWDLREFLYCLVSRIPEDTVLCYDLSEVVNAGYYEESDEICQDHIDSLIEDFHVNEKTLILTEWKTDIEFLRPTLQELYPEYFDYYSFLDFDLWSIQGGNSIEQIIKWFIWSAVKNRIIVLFDNDTAWKQAIKNLNKLIIPENIKILQYPDVEIGNSYPTIGPTWEQNININWLSWSIELYLWRDVLVDSEWKLELVQWVWYNPNLKQYQWSFVNKFNIQERFREKLKNIRSLKRKDHPELVAIFETIFTAFI